MTANAAAAAPPWAGMQGTKRIMTEFKYMSKQVASKQLAQVHDLELVGDNVHKWRFKLKDFDDDVPGGKQLNKDLRELQRKHGMDHLLMEATFPPDYPTRPFFLRVVLPRCQWYTGHVTAGGSICIESLTLSGTPGSWQASFCVEALLTAVITNMVDCESVIVRTASGPGGTSGPLRIDLQGRYGPTMMEYSEGEAKAAFGRQQQHHAVNGWGGDQGSNASSGSGNGGGAAATWQAAGAGPSNSSPAAGSRVTRKRSGDAAAAGEAAAAAGTAAAAAAGGSGSSQIGQPSSGQGSAGAGSGLGVGGGVPVHTQAHKRHRRNAVDSGSAGAGGAAAAVAAVPMAGAAAMPPPASQQQGRSAATTAGQSKRFGGAAVGAGAIDLTLDDDSGNEDVAVVGVVTGAVTGHQSAAQAVVAVGKPPAPTVVPQQAQAAGSRLQAAARRHAAAAKGKDGDDDDDDDDDDNDDVVLVVAVHPPGAAGPSGGAGAGAATAASAGGRAGRAGPGGVARARGRARGAPSMAPAAPVIELLQDEDPATAELEALRAKYEALQQQLAKEKASAGAGLLAPLPDYWDPMDPEEEATVKYVELPLPEAPAAGALSEVCQASLEEMKLNGVPELEAGVALKQCGDDLAAAYGFYFESLRQGTHAAEALAKAKADMADRGRKLQAECSKVVSLFRQQMAATKVTIKRVERVQNWRLWTKYTIRKKEVEEAAQGSANETQLWHGTPRLDNITSIVTRGFDFRLSSLGCALGTGVYLAASASYSHSYSTGGAFNAGAGLAAASGSGGFGAYGAYAGHHNSAHQANPYAAAAAAMQGLVNKLSAQAGVPAGGGGGGKGGKGRGKTAKQGGTKDGADHTFAGKYAMLLCRAALGRVGAGMPSLRLPPPGFDSVANANISQIGHLNSIYAVFDNAQVYPEYIVMYD